MKGKLRLGSWYAGGRAIRARTIDYEDVVIAEGVLGLRIISEEQNEKSTEVNTVQRRGQVHESGGENE